MRRQNVPLIAVLSTLFLLVGAVAVLLAERGGERANITGIGDAIWFVAATMTTVGYGDYVPTTWPGRLVGMLLMIGGWSLISLLTATIASLLVTQRIKEGLGLERLTLRRHVLVCGWNEHAERVLDGLFAAADGEERVALVADLPEDHANYLLFRHRDVELRYVHGDPALETVLERASVRYARSAIVLADTSRGFAQASDERTALVTLTLKSLRPEIKVTAEALDPRSEAHLRRAGADEIVVSGEFHGFLLSAGATAPGMSQLVRQLLSQSGSALRVERVPSEFIGRGFGDLARTLRQRGGFLALALVSERQRLTLDDLLTDDYSLVDQFIKHQFSEAGREYLRFEESGTRVVVNPPDSHPLGEHDAVIGIPGSG